MGKVASAFRMIVGGFLLLEPHAGGLGRDGSAVGEEHASDLLPSQVSRDPASVRRAKTVGCHGEGSWTQPVFRPDSEAREGMPSGTTVYVYTRNLRGVMRGGRLSARIGDRVQCQLLR
ncbi:hypothetical protein LX36DRAFT_649105 [Colletotrichum falcatum]|nr:hypothetical protein LX36DRAFT_649105 [Colletotrichum falcatum]